MTAAGGIPHEDLDWGPTIDPDACREGCRVCLDFCQQGVYEAQGGRVSVARRGACIVGCSHCEGLCESGAISFPSFEDWRRAHPRA